MAHAHRGNVAFLGDHHPSEGELRGEVFLGPFSPRAATKSITVTNQECHVADAERRTLYVLPLVQQQHAGFGVDAQRVMKIQLSDATTAACASTFFVYMAVP